MKDLPKDNTNLHISVPSLSNYVHAEWNYKQYVFLPRKNHAIKRKSMVIL